MMGHSPPSLLSQRQGNLCTTSGQERAMVSWKRAAHHAVFLSWPSTNSNIGGAQAQHTHAHTLLLYHSCRQTKGKEGDLDAHGSWFPIKIVFGGGHYLSVLSRGRGDQKGKPLVY